MNLNKISNLLIALPILILSACSSTTEIATAAPTALPSAQPIEMEIVTPATTPAEEVVTPLTESELLVQQYGEAILQTAIHFDLDKAVIKPEFTPTLQAHAAYLKEHQDKLLTIEGYTDEQGSAQYNLGLGARRAAAVATYLENTGVEPAQLKTSSFGEAMPANNAHNETAWMENRRAELVF